MPLEYYPPATNLLDYLVDNDKNQIDRIKVYSCVNVKGRQKHQVRKGKINEKDPKLKSNIANNTAIFRSPFPKVTHSTHSVFKIKNWRFISIFGQYTYAIYLIHMVFIQAVSILWYKFSWYDNAFIDILVKTSIMIIMTYIVSALSSKYFESPFLKLKTKFAA